MRCLILRSTSLLLTGLLLLAACSSRDPEPTGPAPSEPVPASLLALGDSYTAGQSIPEAWSWPAQLADSLAAGGEPLQRRVVIARTGWTTRDLLTALRDSLEGGLAHEEFGAVALLIGVNNQFQGWDPEIFAADLDTLLDLATELTGGRAARVLGLTIPDYSITPVGQLFDPAAASRQIAGLNGELVIRLEERGMPVVDVAALCEAAAQEPELVARDGLHYSGEMYARWVKVLLPAVRDILGG